MLALIPLVTLANAYAGPSPSASEPAGQTIDPSLDEARRAFSEGTALASRMRWAEALDAYRSSFAKHPHAATQFNIGLALRALGQYTQARLAFASALSRGAEFPDELPEDLGEDANAQISEIDRILVWVSVHVEPAIASLLVDGHPLEPSEIAGQRVFLAGSRAPGPPEPALGATFAIVLDPGTHLLAFASSGFQGRVLERKFRPGSHDDLLVHLDQLPGRLTVTATEPGALVRIDSVEAGPAPVTVGREPGLHSVSVSKPDYTTYEAGVLLQAGDDVSLRATLRHAPDPITRKWWFWGGIGTIVAAAVVGTVVATRTSAQRAPVDGGSLGWSVDLR
jgi:hypothetical protein